MTRTSSRRRSSGSTRRSSSSASAAPTRTETELELTLELLPDVPVGKLVVSDARVTTREQVLDLEQAGVDAVLLTGRFSDAGGLEATLAELTGRSEPRAG